MSVTQTGHERIIASLLRLERGLATGPQKALAASGNIGVTEAKRLVPVRTGRLQGSIRADVTTDTLTLGGYTHYARFVELGTGRMFARPYILPGMERAFAQLIKNLNSELGQGLT